MTARKRKPRRRRAVSIRPRRDLLVDRLVGELRRTPPGTAARARDLFEIIMGVRR
jgi:hypothetical protein